MRMHKNATLPTNAHRNHGERLKDEVYRHMFRLEAKRPGAERDLAVALVRAWMASDSGPKAGVERPWLRKICPICLAMIDAAVQAGEGGQPSIH
jgi:hypothetical protein